MLLPLDNAGGGGISRASRGLALALAAQLAPDEQLFILGDVAAEGLAPGVHVTPSAGVHGGRIRRALNSQLAVSRRARGVDLVHMIDHRAPYLSSRRFSITVHDVTFLDHPAWYPRHVAAYKRHTLTLSLRRRPALIVCYSHDTRERLRHHHPEIPDERVRVIYAGVSPAPPPPAPAPPPPEPYFLTVSAVEPRKNHLGLLRAFQRARAEGLNLQWRIVGGPQYGGESIMEQLREQPGVEVLGRVGDAKLEALYRQAAFVALPSWAEGFGYPPLEAMAREVPVVCSTGSGLDETAGDAALRVPPDDLDGWATALLRLAGDGELRRGLVARGRAQVQRFGWQECAVRHLEAFRQVSGA